MAVIIDASSNARSDTRKSVGSCRHISPNIRLQIRMSECDSRIDDRNYNVACVSLSIPGLGCLDLQHVPLLRPHRIPRYCIDRLNFIIRLGVNDIWIVLVAAYRFGNRYASWIIDHEQVRLLRQTSSLARSLKELRCTAKFHHDSARVIPQSLVYFLIDACLLSQRGSQEQR